MAVISYIQQLIAQGEHQQLDFKFGITDSRKIARSMVAFSNTKGGTLLIGVKDNGSIAGVRSEEEFYMIEAAANMYCKPEIQFQARSHNEIGKSVLEIIIPANEEELHYASHEDGKWLAYLRVGDQNILANNIWIRVWKRDRNPKGTFFSYSDTEKTLFQHLLNQEKITLSAFCKLCGIARKKAENILVNLISLGLIKIEFTSIGIFYLLDIEGISRLPENQKPF